MGANILILNLTRIGDLIQTTPLVKSLRASAPDARITMLANAKFASILDFVDGIDETIVFDIHRFGSMDGSEPDVLAVYEYLDRLTADLAARRFDTVINLSHSKLTAMMARLIGAGEYRGFAASHTGDRLVFDPWLTYFTSMLNFRRLNTFNLVDMYIRGGGGEPGGGARLGLSVSGETARKAKERMRGLGVRPEDIVIGIQAGASRPDRRWSPQRFAAVADHFVRTRGAKIVLFGAPSEKGLGGEVEAAMESPVINLIGETSLGELCAWVKRADLLVTNDTGTMHIAAALGTPIVALFFVHARAEETGPYTEKAVILQADIDCAPCSHQTKCDHYSCIGLIAADDVIAAGQALLDGGDIPTGPGLFTGVKVLKGAFHRDGGIEVAPLFRPALREDEFLARILRPLLTEALSRWDAPGEMVFPALGVEGAMEDIKARFSPAPGAQLDSWTARAAEGAKKTASLGAAVARASADGSRAAARGGMEAKKAAARIAAAEQEISAVAGVYEAAGPLAHVYRRRLESLDGADAAALARQARMAGEWLEAAAGMLAEAMERAREAFLGEPSLIAESGGE